MFYIAALGWEHPGWRDSFYPHDLPHEWRLDYYGNEFAAVVVPASAWLSADAERLAGWCEAVSPEFRFFLAVDAAGSVVGNRIEVVRRALAEHFGGVVLMGGETRPPIPAPEIPFSVLPSAGARANTGRLAVAACDPTAAREPRTVRRLMEGLREGPGDALLVFTGEPPEVEGMRAAQVILDLLPPSR